MSELYDALSDMESNWSRMGWYSFSSRMIHKRAFVLAEELGLAKSEMCEIADDDGWVVPDRKARRGWTLTELGRKWLEIAEDHPGKNGYPTLTNIQIYHMAKEAQSVRPQDNPA